MCLISLAIEVHPQYPLVMVANRDEFYQRPTSPLHCWAATPTIFAGQDMQHGGTWAAWSRDGRFAAVTNIRRPGAHESRQRSRGELPLLYLQDGPGDDRFTHEIERSADEFAPFNLLYGTSDGVMFLNSDLKKPQKLPPGIHGLSNASLNTPWPKLCQAREELRRALEIPGSLQESLLYECLTSTARFPDRELPDTGVGLPLERVLSPPFIQTETYGTRSSWIYMRDRDGQVLLSERCYVGMHGPESYTARVYRFTLG